MQWKYNNKRLFIAQKLEVTNIFFRLQLILENSVKLANEGISQQLDQIRKLDHRWWGYSSQ